MKIVCGLRDMQKEKQFFLVYIIVFLLCVKQCGGDLKISIPNGQCVTYVNKSILIGCEDEDSYDISWISPNGKSLGKLSHPKVSEWSLGKALHFDKVFQNDTGLYICTNGDKQIQFNLTVINPIQIINAPILQYGEEATDISLTCEAIGDNIEIYWLNGTSGQPFNSSKYKKIKDGSLIVRNASIEDSGIYLCQIIQATTADIKHVKIRLKVQHKPYLISNVREYAWGHMNGIVNLTCQAGGEPMPAFKWYRNYKRILRGYTECGYKSVLSVHLKNETDFGTYLCKAFNYLGSRSVTFTVYPTQKPDPPHQIELKNQEPKMLEIAIHKKEDIPKNDTFHPYSYYIHYRMVDEDDWKMTEMFINRDNSYPIFQLLPATTYEVKVASKNIAGLSEFSESKFFTTSEGFLLQPIKFSYILTAFLVLFNNFIY